MGLTTDDTAKLGNPEFLEGIESSHVLKWLRNLVQSYEKIRHHYRGKRTWAHYQMVITAEMPPVMSP